MIGLAGGGGGVLGRGVPGRRLWRLLAGRRAPARLAAEQPGPDQATALPAAEAPGARADLGGMEPGRADAPAIVAEAFETLQREIHAFALHSTRDPDAAADVTQEVFLRLLGEVRSRQVPDNVRAWCYRVAANLLVNQVRRTTIADRWRRIVAGPDRVAESPERSALDRERDAIVQSALADLPLDARTALLLAAHGFSGREIAVAIGRSEAATRTMLCRARVELRGRLASFRAEA